MKNSSTISAPDCHSEAWDSCAENSLRSNALNSIVSELRLRIIYQQIPREMILSEVTLAEQYKVSRGSVRTVLQLLEKEGFIKVLKNGRKQVVGLSAETLSTIWDLRNYVECTAADKILSSVSRDVSPITQVLSQIYSSGDSQLSLKKCIMMDMAIHRSIVLASNNYILLNVWDSISAVQVTLLQINANDWYKEEYVNQLIEVHKPLIFDLLQHNRDVIDKLVAHIDKGKGICLSTIRQIEDGSLQYKWSSENLITTAMN